jgi:hypothetical protein
VKRSLLSGVLALALTGGAALAQSQVRFFGYTQARDPLTDADRSRITTLELGEPGQSGQREAILQLRCQGNSQTGKTELYVALEHKLRLPEWATQSATQAQVYWQFRFDKAKASPQWLSYFSEDGSRIYLSDEARASFVQGLRAAKELVIVAAIEDRAPETFRFSINLAEEGLKKLKCSAPKPS